LLIDNLQTKSKKLRRLAFSFHWLQPEQNSTRCSQWLIISDSNSQSADPESSRPFQKFSFHHVNSSIPDNKLTRNKRGFSVLLLWEQAGVLTTLSMVTGVYWSFVCYPRM